MQKLKDLSFVVFILALTQGFAARALAGIPVSATTEVSKKNEEALLDHSKSKKVASYSLESIMKKYRAALQVNVNLERKMTSEVLQTTKVYEGKFFYSKPRFRLEIEKPEKSLLVFDGNFIWSEQIADSEFGSSEVQVLKTKLSKKKSSQILLAKVLQAPSSKLKLKKESGAEAQYQVEELASELGVKNLLVTANKETLLISAIQYEDDIGNKTELILKNTEFMKSKKPELFKYKAPKGSKVTNI